MLNPPQVDYAAEARAASEATVQQIQAYGDIAVEQAERNLSFLDPADEQRDPEGLLWQETAFFRDAIAAQGSPFQTVEDLGVEGTQGLSSRLAASAALDAGGMNTMMRDEIERDVNDLLGTGSMGRLFQQSLDSNQDVLASVSRFLPQMRETVDGYLRGEIPDDVADRVRMRSAEQSLANFGRIEGPASEGLEARELAKTSMQIQQLGAQLAPQVSAFAGLPIQSAGRRGLSIELRGRSVRCGHGAEGGENRG
jgi:hypothetical protein